MLADSIDDIALTCSGGCSPFPSRLVHTARRLQPTPTRPLALGHGVRRRPGRDHRTAHIRLTRRLAAHPAQEPRKSRQTARRPSPSPKRGPPHPGSGDDHSRATAVDRIRTGNRPRSWPPGATSPSAGTGWPEPPRSPRPAGTPPGTPTGPSRCSNRRSQLRRHPGTEPRSRPDRVVFRRSARAVPAPVGRDARAVRAGSGAVLLRAAAREVHESEPAGRPGTYAETSRTERGDHGSRRAERGRGQVRRAACLLAGGGRGLQP